MFAIFKSWLPLGFTIICLCGSVYLVGQQSLRLSANDPQIQLSEDLAAKLALGATPQQFFSAEQVDISKSLSPFTLVYDEAGNILFSNASLEGKNPQLPQGVLDSAKQKTQNKVTWEPKTGVRIASVVTYFNGTNKGFVLTGRSLREVENRTDQLLKQVEVAAAVSLLGSLILFFMIRSKAFKKD